MDLNLLFTALTRWVDDFPVQPAVEQLAETGDSPFRILVATMLSARTRDVVTIKVSRNLFNEADTPAEICALSDERLQDILRPIGFFNTKAANLKKTACEVHHRLDDRVPDSLSGLTTLPGVGLKTATLVMIKAFGSDAICVDTHVHRIVNMWGIVDENTPERTRTALMKHVPKQHWREVNRTLVTLGQHICGPVKKRCGMCPVNELCPVAFSTSGVRDV